MQIAKNIRGFLKEIKMDAASYDLAEICKSILEEMELGLAGKPSSLEMIPTYVDVPKKNPVGKTVAVFDAGGTNFRTALVSFTEEGTLKIIDFKQASMPGIEKELTKEEFFNAIAELVRETAQQTDKIGFCFSYPSEITPQRDGRLLRFTKEIKAPQVIGELIGENLLTHLQMKNKSLVILNDTVATLLAGKADSLGKPYSGYVGFILGTGCNASYTEDAQNITKKPGLRGHQIINIELGNFNKLQRGQIDLELDAKTVTPGFHVFEKMISGAYLGILALLCMKKAGEAKLLSQPIAEKIYSWPNLETKELSAFLQSPTKGNLIGDLVLNSQRDREALYIIGSEIVERAAKLAAAALSACVLKEKAGRYQSAPVCLTAEGSTFYKLKGLRENIIFYLKLFLQQKRKRYFEITSVPEATLRGAALAGLS